MQKVLIIEDNILQSKQIINYISKNNEDIKLYSISYTCKEALDIIKTEKADIILLDLNLPDSPGTQIIEFIQANNIKKYIGSIIVITGERQMFLTIKDSPYNFSYNGTRYLSETIFEIYKKEDFLIDNLKKDIYPIIAKRHNKSVNTICGNIKQATKCMCLDCDEKILNDYFCYSYFVKPKLKEIIFTILNKI